MNTKVQLYVHYASIHDSSKYTTPGYLSDENYDVGKETPPMWKKANIITFAFTKPY